MTGWQQIGDNINTVAIAAGGDSLYELHNNGHIWRYDGTWKQLDNNPATKQIIAAGDDLYQIRDNGYILKYTR